MKKKALTPICFVTGTEMNWDESHSPIVSIGGDDSVVKTIYSTSGAVTVYEGDTIVYGGGAER